MADVRITDLPAAASVGATDSFVIVDATSQTKKATGAQIQAALGGTAAVAADIAKSTGTTIDRVQGFQGRPLATTAPVVGQQYVWNGTQHVPAGRTIHVSLFGGVPDADFAGGGTDLADAIEAAIRSLDPTTKTQSAIIQLDATPGKAYKMGRTPLISQACVIRGHGGSMFAPGTTILCEPGVTGLRVAGSDNLVVSPSGAFNCVIEDITIKSRGQDLAATTGDYDGSQSKVVSGASNTTPIVITTTTPHSYVTGDTSVVSAVGGNTAANGTWTITVLSPTTFSLNGSVGNGAYTSGGIATTTTIYRVLNVASMTSFNVGSMVAIEGCGQPCTLQNTLASATIGSPTVTLTTDRERIVLAMGDAGGGDGVPVGAVLAGWMITIPGAYPYPTRVVSVNGPGTTLTMASNAAATATSAPVRWRAPLVGYIVSATANSMTIDAYGASFGDDNTINLVMTAAAGRAVTIHHWDCGIDVRNKVKIRNVTVGGPNVTDGFLGAAFAMRGDHGNIPQSTGVNLSTIRECESYHNRHAIFTVGADANASTYTSVQSSRSWDWSFVDISTLGNTYIGTHSDGSHGIVTHDPTGCACVLIYPYTEAGTVNSLGPGCQLIGDGATYQGGTNFNRGRVNALQVGIAAFNNSEIYLGQQDQYWRAKGIGAAGSLSFSRIDVSSSTNAGKYFRFCHELGVRNHALCIADDDQSVFRAGSIWFPQGIMLGDDPAFNFLDTSEATRIEACKADAGGGGPVHRDPRLGYFDSGSSATGSPGAWRKGDLHLDRTLTDGSLLRVITADGHGAATWTASTAFVQNEVVRPSPDKYTGSYFTKTSAGSQTSGATEPTWSSAPAVGNSFTDADGITWQNSGVAAYYQPIDISGYMLRAITTSETWAQTDRHFLCGSVEVTGALAADATLTLPVGRYTRWLWNHTTGAHNLLVKCATGNTVTIANGMGAFVQCTGVEMRRKTADVAP